MHESIGEEADTFSLGKIYRYIYSYIKIVENGDGVYRVNIFC